MAVEGLKNIIGIHPVKKEREPGSHQKQKQKRHERKKKRDEGDEGESRNGHVDIRV